MSIMIKQVWCICDMAFIQEYTIENKAVAHKFWIYLFVN